MRKYDKAEPRTTKGFRCEKPRCKQPSFEAKTGKHEAPACPACDDSEWVIRSYDPKPYFQAGMMD